MATLRKVKERFARSKTGCASCRRRKKVSYTVRGVCGDEGADSATAGDEREGWAAEGWGYIPNTHFYLLYGTATDVELRALTIERARQAADPLPLLSHSAATRSSTLKMSANDARLEDSNAIVIESTRRRSRGRRSSPRSIPSTSPPPRHRPLPLPHTHNAHLPRPRL